MLVGFSAAMPQYNNAYEEDNSYKEYNYNYHVIDEEGNQQGHSSQQDLNGVVTGTMFIQLSNGLFRQANYVSDQYGFRIVLDTNEPGVGSDNSADAQFNVSDPPAGIYEDRGRGRQRQPVQNY